jgi:hypothetical protein
MWRSAFFFSSAWLSVLSVACGGKAVIDESSDGTTTSSSSSTTSGGGGTVTFEMFDALVYANCQPVAPPDPLAADFTMGHTFSGGPGDHTVTVTGASLQADVGVVFFDVSPSEIVVSSENPGIFMLYKDAGSASGTYGCDFCGAADITFELAYELEGTPGLFNYPIDSMSCTK